MSMFDKYDNIPEGYVPNNISYEYVVKKTNKSLRPSSVDKPSKLINACGHLFGYYWYKGDTINLNVNVAGQIRTDLDAILFTTTQQAPTTQTVGHVGQKAYNTYDLLSWTCTATSPTYTWAQDASLTYPENGQKVVPVNAATKLAGKYRVFTIYNFRFEPIYVKEVVDNSFSFSIDDELEKLLIPGVYHFTFTVEDRTNNTVKTLIGKNQYTLYII